MVRYHKRYRLGAEKRWKGGKKADKPEASQPDEADLMDSSVIIADVDCQ